MRNRGLSSLLLATLLVVSCAKVSDYDQYSAYYPDLMEHKYLREFPFIGFPRNSTHETQMELVNGVLYIMDAYDGIHALRNTDKRKVYFLIAPGCTQMTPYSSGIVSDRTVDLITFGKKGNQTVDFVGQQLDVLDELAPPDGKEIPPIFQRQNRQKNTEIIRWEK